jgi:hypothetical protein
MEIDYKQVFEAFQKYLDEECNEIERSNIYYESGKSYSPYTDSRRKFFEAYYLRDSVSEEDFLKVCSALDNDLYDDYKDMFEPGFYYIGIPLEHYVYELQRITGKHPSKVKKWIHLKVEPKQEEENGKV